MKVYKNFDEKEEKFKKLPRKYYENLKKNWLVLNMADILKKIGTFEKIWSKFWNSSGLKKIWLNYAKKMCRFFTKPTKICLIGCVARLGDY